MVNTTQEFSTRYPLVDGQGNFGSMDGDGAAAMRYTEARMSKIGTYMLQNIDKGNVDFIPNFDATEQEPEVLPTLIPNILINGTQGIAVGMATNMMPHNVTEVYDALIYIIDSICSGVEPETERLLEYIKGPDFPLGAQIVGVSGIRDAYLTGKGKIKMRSVYHEEKRKGYPLIVFTELPYKINKLNLVEKIDEIAKDRIPEIREVIDESGKSGVRVTIELKKDADINFVLARLFKYTDLEMSETINNLALVNGVPKVLTLTEILEHFLEHAIDVVRRESAYDLNKAEHRIKIVKAILWAIHEDHIDNVVHIIRKSKSQTEAQEGLAAYYMQTNGAELDQDQLKAISEMRLRQLTTDNCEKYEEEKVTLESTIEYHTAIVNDDMVLLGALKERFIENKRLFGDERRTQIIADDSDITIEDLVKDETLILTYTSEGIIKTVEESTYTATNRGAKGVKGSSINEDEHITHLMTINSKDHLFFFTNKGKCMALRAFMIPKVNRTSRGKYIGNYLPALDADEKVVGFAATSGKDEDNFFFLTTKDGTVKRLSFEDLPKLPRGATVITIKENDELISINVVKEDDEVMVTTDNAMSIRFKVSDIRPTGRTAAGVRGIKLREGDKAVDAIVVNKEAKILTMTENGLVKRTDFEEYRVANRGGVGITTHKLTERTGKLVCALAVDETEEILIATQQGQIVRTKVSGISVTGRSTSGVIALRLAEGDSIVSVSKLKGSEEETEDVEQTV